MLGDADLGAPRGVKPRHLIEVLVGVGRNMEVVFVAVARKCRGRCGFLVFIRGAARLVHYVVRVVGVHHLDDRTAVLEAQVFLHIQRYVPVPPQPHVAIRKLGVAARHVCLQLGDPGGIVVFPQRGVQRVLADVVCAAAPLHLDVVGTRGHCPLESELPGPLRVGVLGETGGVGAGGVERHRIATSGVEDGLRVRCAGRPRGPHLQQAVAGGRYLEVVLVAG